MGTTRMLIDAGLRRPDWPADRRCAEVCAKQLWQQRRPS